MSPRLASSLLVSALLRRAEAEGGFGAVLVKGDPDGGAIAISLLERGQRAVFLERLLQPDGHYAWQSAQGDSLDEEKFRDFLARRRNFDPDMWILELDVPSAERFAAEMIEAG
jgi:hypothetical protein